MKYVNKVYDYKIIRIGIMINKRNWSLTYFFFKKCTVSLWPLFVKVCRLFQELLRMCGIIRIFVGNFNLNDYEKNHELGVFLHPRLQ